MKDDATQSATKSTPAPSGMASQFGIWTSGHALENWAQASASVINGAIEISQEIVKFSQDQVQAGMDAWKTGASCRNPNDVFEWQRQLAERTAARYLDEARKLTSRTMELISDAAAPFRKEAASKS